MKDDLLLIKRGILDLIKLAIGRKDTDELLRLISCLKELDYMMI